MFSRAQCFLAVSFFVALAAVPACSSTTNVAPGSDGGSSGGSSGGSADGGLADGGSTAPLTCLEIFQCAADCTGTACEDACGERGSEDAKSAATGVVNCFQTNSCTDAACLQTKCTAELGACAAQATPTGGTPVTTVPAGTAVDSTLAGTWHSFYEPNQATRDWTFNADGTTTYYNTGAYDMPGGCKWGLITESTGTVVVEGDKVTYYQTGGTQQSSQCGQIKTEPAPQGAYAYRWSIEANGQLLLVDLNTPNCLANPQWDSCRKNFDRK